MWIDNCVVFLKNTKKAVIPLKIKVFAFLLLAALFLFEAKAFSASATEKPNYLVFFKSASSPPTVALGFKSFASEANRYLDDFSFADPRQDDRVKNISYISNIDLPGTHRQTVVSHPWLALALPTAMLWPFKDVTSQIGVLMVVQFYTEEEAETVLGEWERQELIWFYEPDRWNEIKTEGGFTLTHNQLQQVGSRWWLDDINFTNGLQTLALKESAAGLNSDQYPVIAVFDSGIDHLHPALREKIWVNPYPGMANCKDDVRGCNMFLDENGSFGNGDSYPFGAKGPNQFCPQELSNGKSIHDGSCMHGTHVAGIIAGDINAGVWGICPVCQILNVKVIQDFKGFGRVADSSILNGLKYISLLQRDGKNLVRVINSSFGKFQESRSISLFLSHLKTFRDGMLMIAAAGNEDSQRHVYPAASSDVIAVAAVGHSGKKASYSNYGPWVNISAPGGEQNEGLNLTIESSVPGGGVAYSQGTSMATPMVSGVAGLILANKPDQSLAELKESLLLSADPRLYAENFADGYNYRNYYVQRPGERERSPLLGTGILDIYRAINGTKQSKHKEARYKNRVTQKCGMIKVSSKDPNMKPPHVAVASMLLASPIWFCLGIVAMRDRLANRGKANRKRKERTRRSHENNHSLF